MSDNHPKMQKREVDSCDFLWYIATINIVNQWRTGLKSLLSRSLLVRWTSLSLPLSLSYACLDLKRQEITAKQSAAPPLDA